MRSGEDIQEALRAFVTRWQDYRGTEREGAQTFLNELFACYGTDRMASGARFEDPQASGGIVDLLWPETCIVEMKAPGEADRLARHKDQAFGYWYRSDDVDRGIAAPPFLVICAFHRFQVWQPGRFPSAGRPTLELTLDELPAKYEALLFLAGQQPYFQAGDRELTTEATKAVVELVDRLEERQAAPANDLQLFVLQVVWCLFAGRLGLMEGRPVEKILDRLQRDDELTSAVLFGHLFTALNDPEDGTKQGLYEGVRFANGGLFERSTHVALQDEEVQLLRQISRYDWSKVNPTIFGSLMEGYVGRGQRAETGAHYTHEIDILKIVEPTIVLPWQERIDAASTVAEAEVVLRDLCQFRVLDPACGCGNFLYVAYRKLRDLEAQAKHRIAELARSTGSKRPEGPLPSYPISNLYGIEILPFSVQLSRVTLWMGHKLAADEHGLAEPVLPLVDLSHIKFGDALKVEWPEVEVVIGNPPFNGSQWLRKALGDDYVEWLKREFGCGIKDYCVYWFRRAHDHLGPGGRAGLVGTNSISQNRGRTASLDYIAANGGVITDAVSTQKWPGEAKVHVSLVNWVKEPQEPITDFRLDRVPVEGISTDLRPSGLDTTKAAVLEANKGKAFQGPIPVGAGFILSDEEAKALLARGDADYAEVVRPFLTGHDIADDPSQSPSRWIIDFGDRSLEEAMGYRAALEVVEDRVRPFREANNRRYYRQHWWRFGEPRRNMRSAVATLSRFIASNEVGKRILFCWCERTWCPNNKTNVFAFDDDYSFAVLSSKVHDTWGWVRSGTLKADVSYTPTSAFLTFPWPEPTAEQRERIGGLGRRIVERRQEVCRTEEIGLTELYNRVDDGAYEGLRKLHEELDEAVVEAYGWPKAVAKDSDEIVRRLLALNLEIASGKREYDPFGAKGSDRPMVLPE